jgi:hypothetical protein
LATSENALVQSRWARHSLALLAQALALEACSAPSPGASSTAASCPSVTRCGGDVAGTWQIDSECIVMAAPFAEPECRDVVQQSTVDASGSVTYTPGSDPASGTQTLHLEYTLAITHVYSAACLRAIGSGAASPASCQGLELYWAGAYSVTCAPMNDACECHFADQNTLDQVDDYTLAGEQIVLASSGPVDYCRQGDGLVESTAPDASASFLSLHLGAPEGG